MDKTPDFDVAAAFMAGHARLLDRRMFQRLFSDGAAGAVRDAVAAYRNSDGGFGYALEPDCRAAASQPAAVEMALRMMDLADEWDSRLVGAAVDWLAPSPRPKAGRRSSSPPWPRGRRPLVGAGRGAPASLIQTGQIAGAARARVRAPVARPRDQGDVVADRRARPPGGYEMFGVLAFLQHVPDRARATAAFARVGPLLTAGGLVALTRRPRACASPLGPRAAFVARPRAILQGHDRGAPGPPGGRSVTTAAGRWTGHPGHLRRGRLARLPHRRHAARAARQRPRLTRSPLAESLRPSRRRGSRTQCDGPG